MPPQRGALQLPKGCPARAQPYLHSWRHMFCCLASPTGLLPEVRLLGQSLCGGLKGGPPLLVSQHGFPYVVSVLTLATDPAMTKVCMSPAPARRWDDILLRTHPLRPRLAWFLGVALAAGAGAAPGQQRSLGPDVPHVRVVGRSPGFAPMIGLDSSRTGSSRSRLPTWPEAEWAYHVDGGLTGPAAVLRLGQAHVASPAGHLAAVSAAGIPLWKLRLDTPAAAPPRFPRFSGNSTAGTYLPCYRHDEFWWLTSRK